LHLQAGHQAEVVGEDVPVLDVPAPALAPEAEDRIRIVAFKASGIIAFD